MKQQHNFQIILFDVVGPLLVFRRHLNLTYGLKKHSHFYTVALWKSLNMRFIPKLWLLSQSLKCVLVCVCACVKCRGWVGSKAKKYPLTRHTHTHSQPQKLCQHGCCCQGDCPKCKGGVGAAGVLLLFASLRRRKQYVSKTHKDEQTIRKLRPMTQEFCWFIAGYILPVLLQPP